MVRRAVVSAGALLPALALVLNAFVWGVSWWPFRELQSHGLHPLWATALIYLVSMACLLAVKPHAWHGFRSQPLLWLLMAAAGMTNVGFNWAVTVGDVVRVVLLFYLMPAWTVLLAWPILGEKPTPVALFLTTFNAWMMSSSAKLPESSAALVPVLSCARLKNPSGPTR